MEFNSNKGWRKIIVKQQKQLSEPFGTLSTMFGNLQEGQLLWIFAQK